MLSLLQFYLLPSRLYKMYCALMNIKISRVRHKHSPTRHGEWKFHLASTTWKSLAKMASMKFGQNKNGEYEIKVTRQILICTYILIAFKHVSKIIHIFNDRWKFCSRLRRSQTRYKYDTVLIYSINIYTSRSLKS